MKLNVEVGMRNAEKELAERLIFIISAFRIPTSAFLCPWTQNRERWTVKPIFNEIENDMKPIFFPYTYISNPVAEAVAACFGRFTVSQPLSGKLPLSMQSLVDKGVIDIRIPVKGDDRELESAAENYLNWANLNIGGSSFKSASLKTLKASAPLLDASLSSQIVADVKKQMNRSATDKLSDPVLAARIFLYFAQEFDQLATLLLTH